MKPIALHGQELPSMRTASGHYIEEDRRQSLARAGMTIATGSLDGHQAVKAKRKRERQNRKAGRR